MRWIGVGYRRALDEWLQADPPEVTCLEITAEHFFDAGRRELRQLSEKYPVFVHGLGLSLGTPGPLDRKTLQKFARVAKLANAHWVSEHVAFTQTREVDLGHLNPIPLDRNSLHVVVEHALEVAERCQKKLILENITSDLRIDGELTETEFLNRLCEEAQCGLLLDVTNLFINSRNHQFDARAWLHELQPENITQLHVVGYSRRAGRWCDHHAEIIQDDLMELVADVLRYAPVEAIILERDARLEETTEISAELKRLQKVAVTDELSNCDR